MNKMESFGLLVFLALALILSGCGGGGGSQHPNLGSTSYIQTMQFGGYGTGNGKFNIPCGLRMDSSGNIYVADHRNCLIQVFDHNGNFIKQFGGSGSGNGKFAGPTDVAIDSSGNIYVADYVNSLIQKFDRNGNFIKQWGGSGSGNGKFGNQGGNYLNFLALAIDSSGNVYVGDEYNNLIQKFDHDGNFIKQWKSGMPRGVAVDSVGNVYVADAGNSVLKYTSDGALIKKWNISSNENGDFSEPYGIAVDSAGNVYVGDYIFHFVWKFTTDGTFVTKWGPGDTTFYPEALFVDSTGNVYVTNGQGFYIQKYAPQ